MIICSNALQEGHTDYDEEDDLLDVFDITEAEPDLLFVNPFGCQVDPLSWRKLQVSPAGCQQYLQATGLQSTLCADGSQCVPTNCHKQCMVHGVGTVFPLNRRMLSTIQALALRHRHRVPDVMLHALKAAGDMQEYAQNAPANKILEDHLLAAGLAMSGSAICWLTPAQLLAVKQELERMEMNLSFELTAWWLSDVLARARVTNNRMSRAGANKW